LGVLRRLRFKERIGALSGPSREARRLGGFLFLEAAGAESLLTVRIERLLRAQYIARQAVQRSLQDEHGRVLIYGFGPAGAAHVGSNKLALGRRGGQPLIPQRDRKLRHAGEVPRKCAGRLRARAFAPIHVDRQAEHKTDGLAFACKRQQTRGIHAKMFSPDCFNGGRNSPGRIARGNAYGLAAEIEPKQRTTRRQVSGRLDERKDQRRHRRGLA
jgi:hypothetical protein